MSADNVTNELSITIRTADTDVTAEQLNNISKATSLNVDASNVTSITGTVTELLNLYDSSVLTGLGDEAIFVNGDLTVTEANALDLLTNGLVTGFIDPSERVSSLVTLTGSNAYNITISAEDATGSTAAQLNTINSATTSQIDATAVTALAPDTLANINQLLFDSFDGDQFYHESFRSLDQLLLVKKKWVQVFKHCSNFG